MTDLTQYSEKVVRRRDDMKNNPINVKDNILLQKKLLLFRKEGNQ